MSVFYKLYELYDEEEEEGTAHTGMIFEVFILPPLRGRKGVGRRVVGHRGRETPLARALVAPGRANPREDSIKGGGINGSTNNGSVLPIPFLHLIPLSRGCSSSSSGGRTRDSGRAGPSALLSHSGSPGLPHHSSNRCTSIGSFPSNSSNTSSPSSKSSRSAPTARC